MAEAVKVPPDIPCREGETHRWRMAMHIDGCHYYGSHYFCEVCRSRFTITIERDLSDDPYSAEFMEPDPSKPCKRCAELMAGAETIEAAIVVEAAVV